MPDHPPDFDLRGLLPNSLLEWEDHIAAVAVAGGCNWRCAYCHGWRYVVGHERDALPPRLPLDALWDVLDRHHAWIDGVVVSGGEPTLQPGLPALLDALHQRRLPVKLHTNGSRPDVLRPLLNERRVHTLALDLKAPLDERLAPVVGGDPNLDAVRDAFALARDALADDRLNAVEYHSTLCPAFLGPPERAAEPLAAMASLLAPSGAWFLQPYRAGDVLDPARAGQAEYDTVAWPRLVALARAAFPGRVHAP